MLFCVLHWSVLHWSVWQCVVQNYVVFEAKETHPKNNALKNKPIPLGFVTLIMYDSNHVLYSNGYKFHCDIHYNFVCEHERFLPTLRILYLIM